MSSESIWIIQDWGEVIESPAVELSDMCLCVGRNRIEKSKKKSPRFKTTKKCPTVFSSAAVLCDHYQIRNGGTNNSHVTLLPHTHTTGMDTEKKEMSEREREREKEGIMEDWSHGYDMEEWACGSRRQFSTHATDTRLLFNQRGKK